MRILFLIGFLLSAPASFAADGVANLKNLIIQCEADWRFCDDLAWRYDDKGDSHLAVAAAKKYFDKKGSGAWNLECPTNDVTCKLLLASEVLESRSDQKWLAARKILDDFLTELK